MTQPPPVPKEAAARAWGELGAEPAPVTARPPVERQATPKPPAPIPERRRVPGRVIAIAAAAVVALVVIAALAISVGDDKPKGASQGTSGTAKGGEPARVANVAEIKNRFPLIAARLAPLNLQPSRRDPTVIPQPFELRPENTGNGWQFTVSQPFALRGVDPNNPIESPVGSTAYNDITVDGFNEAVGATRMREAYVKFRETQGHTVVEPGDAATPTRLQRDGNGFVTTTFMFTSGNALMRFTNVCHLCSPDDVNRDVLPIVDVLRNLFPPGS